MPYIKVTELPETLIAALKEVSYAKKDIQVIIKEKESLFSAGSKGYRGFAMIVNISTGATKGFDGSWGGSNPFEPGNVVDNDQNEYTIPKDGAVIRGFSGGASGITHATITISPQNVLPMLQGGEDVSEEEKHLLAIMRSYKPAYRKPFFEGKEDMINSLIERGYIKRNAAGSLSLSTKGKSACENVRVY